MADEKSNQTGHMKSSMKKGDIAEKYKKAEPHYYKATSNPGKSAERHHHDTAERSSTDNKEPSLRALTTDSSRMPKYRNDDDRPIGGNRR
jgi:hypothetical protein